METPEETLRKWFPDKLDFRDIQKRALNLIWKGRSLVVLMPTGRGKSLLFQLPVLASNSIGVIISPLIALMQQQSKILENAGATVLSLGGADALGAQRDLMRFPWGKGAAFLFISPERAETDGYLEYLLNKNKKRISLVAIDEAHCISQWGHDFRPPYKAIPGFLDRVFGKGGWPVTLCLTATLDKRDQAEILFDFNLKEKDVIKSESMLRSNLDLSFQLYTDRDTKIMALEKLLFAHRGEKLIIYTHLKQNKHAGTRVLSNRFKNFGFRCAPFDADLPMAEKDDTLLKFSKGDIDIVFATGAFGMGVDIPDIRGVIHFLLPESLEQYYQEVGRAGRDGKDAFGKLLYTPVNAKVRRDMIRKSLRTTEEVREVWEQVCSVGRGLIRTLNPWTEFQGKDDEHALFYAFQRVGAVNILARGPNRIKSLEPRTPEAMAFLQMLLEATRTGSTAAAIRKIGIDTQETISTLYELYDKGEIKLNSSPDKTIFFQTREITDEDITKIVSDLTEKVNKRLAAFEQFVTLIESGADPSTALASRFGNGATL
jgi:ATP-dependent DNA helicase RecQ